MCWDRLTKRADKDIENETEKYYNSSESEIEREEEGGEGER